MKSIFQILFVLLFVFSVQTNSESLKKEKTKTINILYKLGEKTLSTDDTLIFKDLDSALAFPEKVVHLIIRPTFIPSLGKSKYYDLKHLPSRIGSLLNLKILEIHCLENLEDLPPEIGQLKKLEKLEINNGNGCQMNTLIPASIGQLQNLKELILYGAIDPRDISNHGFISPSKIKKLPQEIGNLKNLEVLDLGRNGIKEIPIQIQFLKNLRILKLDYNSITEIPSFISNCKKLEELDLTGNQNIKLPDSLDELKNLKVFMKNNSLKIIKQKELIKRFPDIKFDFTNEYIGGNEEPTVK